MAECSLSAETSKNRKINENDRNRYINTMILSNLPSLELITSTGDWNLNAFGEVTIENIPEVIELNLQKNALTENSIIHEDSKNESS